MEDVKDVVLLFLLLFDAQTTESKASSNLIARFWLNQKWTKLTDGLLLGGQPMSGIVYFAVEHMGSPASRNLIRFPSHGFLHS